MWAYPTILGKPKGGLDLIRRNTTLTNYIADNVDPIKMPRGIDRVDFHQYDATPPPPGISGIPTPYNLDLGKRLLDDACFWNFFGKKTPITDAEKLAKLWRAHPELWDKS